MTILELIRLATDLAGRGERDAGGLLMMLANARISGTERELDALCEDFLTTHVLPVLEQRHPGAKEAMAAQLLAEFGPEDARAARVARALRGHG